MKLGVHIVNADGYRFLADNTDRYPVIIVDLPDPRNESLAKLYSQEFYALVARHLARGGLFVQQSSSPFFVRDAYRCIVHTATSAGLRVQPYHAYVPSFGEWGYILASDLALDWSRVALRVPTRFLTPANLPAMTVFDPDTAEVATTISTLQNPAVLHYYLDAWRHWRG